jgi:arylformamidase
VIDYESEYKPSLLVPGYASILERWARDAASYRAQASAALDLAYGDTERQALDLFLPEAERLALFVHGGWWRMLDRFSFSHMARGLNAHGIAVAVMSYDLCPSVSIATIVGEAAAACRFLHARTRKPLLIFGHSAGGHLSACMASKLPEIVRGGYAISGAFDLAPLVHVSMNQDWRLDETSARALSPIHWPAPKAFDCVVGNLESGEFRRQSRALGLAWRARHEELAGANHFSVLDALTDPDSAMIARLVEMAS